MWQAEEAKRKKKDMTHPSDRCSCDSSATFPKAHLYNYRCVYNSICMHIYTYLYDFVCIYVCITYSMCKCTHVHYEMYRSFHMPSALKCILFSKKYGDQMVSPCPSVAACFTLSRRRKKGKSGRRRKPKKRQGDEIDGRFLHQTDSLFYQIDISI